MSSMKFGANTAVFILFFGTALYAAIMRRSWVFAAVFLVVAFLSVRFDALKRSLSSFRRTRGYLTPLRDLPTTIR